MVIHNVGELDLDLNKKNAIVHSVIVNTSAASVETSAYNPGMLRHASLSNATILVRFLDWVF